MEIRKITEDELDYVSAICLDPSIGSRQRKAMQDAMTARIQWLRRMMKKGLQILVALEKPRQEKVHYKWAGDMNHADLAVRGKVPKGLLEFVPIELAPEPVKGKNLLFIDCIWVLPPFWHTGVAKGLMESFLCQAKEYGGASVLTYEGDKWFGSSLDYMPASFFKKFGFKEADRDGSRVLLFLDLGAGKKPRLIHPKARNFGGKNEVVIDALCNSQCPWSGWMVDQIKRNAKRYPRTSVNVVNSDDRKVVEEFGLSRGVYVNKKPAVKRMAPWKEIEKAIEEFRKNSWEA